MSERIVCAPRDNCQSRVHGSQQFRDGGSHASVVCHLSAGLTAVVALCLPVPSSSPHPPLPTQPFLPRRTAGQVSHCCRAVSQPASLVGGTARECGYLRSRTNLRSML